MKLDSDEVRLRNEHVQEKRRDWLAAIIDNAMDAIVTVDQEQKIVLFNKSAENIFGTTALQAIGDSLDHYIPARSRQAHREHVHSFTRSGATSRSMHSPAKLMGLRANGEEFPIEATISRATIGEMVLLTVILRDISGRK